MKNELKVYNNDELQNINSKAKEINALVTKYILNPANGKPVIVPSQDIVLGIYYLTQEKNNEPGEGSVFKDINEIEQALENKALTLHSKISDLVASPSSKSLSAARRAWKNSRVPYQQTEVFRFCNAIVDDWEGRVNSWPLDEGLIDYTDPTLYGSDR